VEDTDGSELADGSWVSKKYLQCVYGLTYFRVGNVAHVADSLSSFDVDHFALVPGPSVK
jgi:hypothetical protein